MRRPPLRKCHIMSYDELERRCPRLGSVVPFHFCRSGESNQPCFKVFDCWWETFDVTAFFKERMSPSEFDRLVKGGTTPPNKVASLVDIIRQAQERVRQE